MTNTIKTLLFRANVAQLCQLMANAVNASVGADGEIPECSRDKIYTGMDMLLYLEPNNAPNPIANLDYVDARMCHLVIYEHEKLNATDSIFEIIFDFDPEQQSFAAVYSSSFSHEKNITLESVHIRSTPRFISSDMQKVAPLRGFSKFSNSS